ncbi:MAG: DUF5818 domain-containing protein [Terriglobales bacterium]
MKRVFLVCVVSLVVMALAPKVKAVAVSSTGVAAAQQGQQDDPKPKPESAMAPGQMQVFTGTVVREKGEWSLMENATNTTYRLDDQTKAKSFEGKTVKVTGTLEPSSRTIHVSAIENGS